MVQNTTTTMDVDDVDDDDTKERGLRVQPGKILLFITSGADKLSQRRTLWEFE